MSRQFLTEYSQDGHPYGENIEADDEAQAFMLALRRGLGERIVSAPRDIGPEHQLAQHIAAHRWIEACHSAIQLAHIGLVSGALTPRETVGDEGLVHMLMHLAVSVDVEDEPALHAHMIERVHAMAKDQERRVPGWPQSYEGHTDGLVVPLQPTRKRLWWRLWP